MRSKNMVKRINRFTVLLFFVFLALNCCFVHAMAAGTRKRLIEETTEGPHERTHVTYDYNRSGQLSQKVVNRNGEVQSTTEYHYYPDGTLFEELYKGIINLYYHYDSNGTVIERDETGGVGSPANYSPLGDTVRTEYDADGHITRFEKLSGGLGSSYTLTYEYDRKGRILSFCVGDTRKDSYDYRPDGSFIRTRDDRDMKLFITEYYNTDGLRTQQDRRQGSDLTSTYYEYDRQGNLIRQINKTNNSEWTWKYDDHGNVIEEWMDGRLICSYQNFYDKDGDLVKSIRSAGDTNLTTTYVYD